MHILRTSPTARIPDKNVSEEIVARRVCRWFTARNAQAATDHGLLDTNPNKAEFGIKAFRIKEAMGITGSQYDSKQPIAVTDLVNAFKHILAIWAISHFDSKGKWSMGEIKLLPQSLRQESRNVLEIQCSNNQTSIKISLNNDHEFKILQQIVEFLLIPTKACSDLETFITISTIVNLLENNLNKKIFTFSTEKNYTGETIITCSVNWTILESQVMGTFKRVSFKFTISEHLYEQFFHGLQISDGILRLQPIHVENYITDAAKNITETRPITPPPHTTQQSAITRTEAEAANTRPITQPQQTTQQPENNTSHGYSGGNLPYILFNDGTVSCNIGHPPRAEITKYRPILINLNQLHQSGWCITNPEKFAVIGKLDKGNGRWVWVMDVNRSSVKPVGNSHIMHHEKAFLENVIYRIFNLNTDMQLNVILQGLFSRDSEKLTVMQKQYLTNLIRGEFNTTTGNVTCLAECLPPQSHSTMSERSIATRSVSSSVS